MRVSTSVWAIVMVALGVGCAAQPRDARAPEIPRAGSAAANPKTPKGAPAPVEGAPAEELPWATLSPETFARAKATRKFIVLDGAAEWCHWCHVMEATTYHDPAVRRLLDEHFIAVKVDVDSRPDIEERYGDYGWPATAIFAPDATEIGKYRGYIAPEKFVEILSEVVASGLASERREEILKERAKAPRTALAE